MEYHSIFLSYKTIKTKTSTFIAVFITDKSQKIYNYNVINSTDLIKELIDYIKNIIKLYNINNKILLAIFCLDNEILNIKSNNYIYIKF